MRSLRVMEFLVFVVASTSGFAAEIPHLTGKLQIADKTKAGSVYLMVRSDGGTGLVTPKLEKNADNKNQEVAPSGPDFQGYLPAGEYDGKGSYSFDIPFPKGSYEVSAFIQNGGSGIAKCQTSEIKGLTIAQSCFPGKGDTFCSAIKVKVPSGKPVSLACTTAVPTPSREKAAK